MFDNKVVPDSLEVIVWVPEDEGQALWVDVLDELGELVTIKDCENISDIEDNWVEVGAILIVTFDDRDGVADSIADEETEDDPESLSALDEDTVTVWLEFKLLVGDTEAEAEDDFVAESDA